MVYPPIRTVLSTHTYPESGFSDGYLATPRHSEQLTGRALTDELKHSSLVFFAKRRDEIVTKQCGRLDRQGLEHRRYEFLRHGLVELNLGMPLAIVERHCRRLMLHFVLQARQRNDSAVRRIHVQCPP